MAGKADLVNSIVDSLVGSTPSELQSIPDKDGWKTGAAYTAADAAPGGSLSLDPLGGAG